MNYFVLKSFRLPNLTNRKPKKYLKVFKIQSTVHIVIDVEIEVRYPGSDTVFFFEERFVLGDIISGTSLKSTGFQPKDFPKKITLTQVYTKDNDFYYKLFLHD